MSEAWDRLRPLKSIHHKALPNDEGLDRIVIEVVPRLKTSGLSGDEWRTSAVTRFYRKGKKVAEVSTGRMAWAVSHLGYHFGVLPEQSCLPLYAVSDSVCNQPSCAEDATTTYRLKEEFSARGQGPLPKRSLEYRRSFCERHKHRGDASREDSMNNYQEME